VASVTVLSMSDGELRRLEVLRDVDRGGLPVGAAAQLLGRSERQVWRLLKAFRRDGAAGLISKKRGRPSNRKTAAAVRAAALWIVRHNYADFGPTLAAEKLAAEHGFAFSSETLRKWMIADGLWLDRKQRQRRVHQPRPRRECCYKAGHSALSVRVPSHVAVLLIRRAGRTASHREVYIRATGSLPMVAWRRHTSCSCRKVFR
jgi:transposase